MKKPGILILIPVVLLGLSLHFTRHEEDEPSSDDAHQPASVVPDAMQTESMPPRSYREQRARQERDFIGIEEAQIATLLAFWEELSANPDARPHLETIIKYVQSAPPESFSIHNLPTNADGLAILDGNATQSIIRDEAIRSHWNALMDIISEDGQ